MNDRKIMIIEFHSINFFKLMTDIEQVKKELSDHGYEYIDTIGSGSFSTVYLCQSTQYKNYFAVKQVLKQELVDHEIDSLISLIHPNIVKLYLTFSNQEYQFLVMEYCSKGTIKQRQKLNYNEFIFYAKQLLEVLEYCHKQKIAHRDIKPDNIFLDQYNHVKLGDFGLSCKFRNQELSSHKCGSLMFCAPEILSNPEFDPFPADIWSLGITFYYMATGHYPFPDHSLESLRDSIINGVIDFTLDDVHPKIQYLIRKMTSKNTLFRPLADQLLKFPVFSQSVHTKITKTISSYPFNLIHQIKNAQIWNQSRNISDTFSSTDDKDDDKESENKKRKKISKIRSFRNCNCYINEYKKNYQHFVKYD